MKTKPIAILTSDWHLRHKPPRARAAEPDWYEAMERPLWEMCQFQRKHGDIPILFAGDMFHHWNEPVELINWAIRKLPPNIWGIPGQHDLPYHQIGNIHKSAYQTLVEIDKIKQSAFLDYLDTMDKKGIYHNLGFIGFPFGQEIRECPHSSTKCKVALIHQYVWKEKAGFTGASNSQHVTKLNLHKHGYTHVVIGDNHKHFLHKFPGTTVVNCGSIRADNADQRDYEPGFYVLWTGGKVTRVNFDCSQDKWIDESDLKELKKVEADFSKLMQDLRKMSATTIDFLELIERASGKKDVPLEVRDLITETIERVSRVG